MLPKVILTSLQAIAVSTTLTQNCLHLLNIYPPHDPINEKEQNNFIKQLPKVFILMRAFNHNNTIRRSKTISKRDQSLKKIVNSNNSCLHNEKFLTHLDPSLGPFFAIDLTFSDPSFIGYNWRVY